MPPHGHGVLLDAKAKRYVCRANGVAHDAIIRCNAWVDNRNARVYSDDMTTETLPSVPQMLNRMNEAHAELLAATRDERLVRDHWRLTAGQLRGYRTAVDTLHRWECIVTEHTTDEAGEHYRRLLSERGSDLLAAWESR